jgi:membrane protease YdiL (CAAX protease family)
VVRCPVTERTPDRRQSVATNLLVLWLFMAFCGTVYLNFSKEPGQAPPQVIQMAERLAVVARYSQDLSPETRQQLYDTAAELETDAQAKAIISGQLPESLDKELLTPTYRLLAAELETSDPARKAELEALASEGLARFTLTVCMLMGIGLFGLITLFLPKSGNREMGDVTELSPTGVLGVFFAWHVFGFIGVSLFAALLGPSIDKFAMILIAQGLLYLWMLVVLSQARLRGPSAFGKFDWSTIGKGYFLCLATVFSINMMVSTLSGEAPRSENPILGLFLDAPAWKFVLLGLLVVVVGPVFEEIIFRGWLFGGLRNRWGDRLAAVVSAALFALIHGDAPGLPALFCLGLIFAGVYRRSGSLYASILVHGLWNATTFSLLISVMP